MDAWRVEIRIQNGMPDPAGTSARTALAAADLTLSAPVHARRGFLIGADLDRASVERLAQEVLADPVTETWEVFAPGETIPTEAGRVSILPLPGVTDQVAHSVEKALRDAGLTEVPVGTYEVFVAEDPVPEAELKTAAERVLANEVIQHVLPGVLPPELPGPGGTADLEVRELAIQKLDDSGLDTLSRELCLALNTKEMRVVQAHYQSLEREPLHIELETIAQTWSEHCKHKTFTGTIRFTQPDPDKAGETKEEIIHSLMKSEIAKVTTDLDRDFCLSVFKDNAGIITFDEEDAVCIKVETHNHPSAIEPFGGAGTGVGGVIRDILGTGLGARPVANTDVFCFAPVDMPAADVPKGCLHPMQVLKGVVSGVRDYGNPMGIPTVNGSIHFDPDFVGNPLVYVGNIGILPRDKCEKQSYPGDYIVSVGGKTGRDGIHGATFSSLELHTDSETVSSGAVQIGDPITERKAMDVVLRARDENLFSAITDCGAGGFSSAIGEMAEGLGATVDLEKAPLKYQGLAPWEIWISEAQERMVMSVPPEHLARVLEICEEEDVEGVEIGKFTDSGRLVLRYDGVVHGDLSLKFMHDGLPKFERKAVWQPKDLHDPDLDPETDFPAALTAVLSDLCVASKEWVIRQYDHEVQAGAAGKPLVGVHNDGPADAAVIAPKLGSLGGVVISNGLNPRYSHIDPASMAECAIDEAMRNLVATGGNPEHCAVLDNYCWGNCEKPERLGELVRATQALCKVATIYRTPFISGKDSLNNEFNTGERTISIPGCILVTAMSVIPDVTRTISTDLQKAGNKLCLVGTTKQELGGSIYWKTKGELGASAPRVDARLGKLTLDGVARSIAAHAVTSCHDLSEGGVAAAAAEMAIGGRKGVRFDLDAILTDGTMRPEEILFSESQSRFLFEISPDKVADVEANLGDVPFAWIGEVTDDEKFTCQQNGATLFQVHLDALTHAFKHPLDLDHTMTEAK